MTEHATFSLEELDRLEQIRTLEWGSAQDVLLILKRVNNREINKRFLGSLSERGKLKRERFDGRTFQYFLPDVWKLHITEDSRRGNRSNHPKGKRIKKRHSD